MKSEFTLKFERCKGCGICAAFCPKQVLALDTLGKIYVAHPENCIACDARTGDISSMAEISALSS